MFMGLLEVLILLFFFLWLALPFIFCLALSVLASNWIVGASASERRRFETKLAIWTPSLAVAVPSYYGSFSAMHTFFGYWIWFYSTAYMIGILGLGWLVGVVIMLVLQYRRALFR
jgi:hypothetical protein